MSTTTTPAKTRLTKKYKALVAQGIDDVTALGILGVVVVPEQADPNAEKVAALVAAGFPEAQAQAIVAGTTNVAAATKPSAPAKVTDKDKADALVTQQGLAHSKGRVYVTGTILEAATRVIKGGAPEVVNTSGVGRVSAVVLFREDSGDVAIQNLYRPV